MKKVNVVRPLPLGGSEFQSVDIEGGEVDALSAFIITAGNSVAISTQGMAADMLNTIAGGTLSQQATCWAVNQIGWEYVAYFWAVIGAMVALFLGQLWLMSTRHRWAIVSKLLLIGLGVILGASVA